jgi:hypothetical protein
LAGPPTTDDDDDDASFNTAGLPFFLGRPRPGLAAAAFSGFVRASFCLGDSSSSSEADESEEDSSSEDEEDDEEEEEDSLESESVIPGPASSASFLDGASATFCWTRWSFFLSTLSASSSDGTFITVFRFIDTSFFLT